MKIQQLLLICSTFLISTPIAAQSLSADEKAIIAKIETQIKEADQFLEKVVNINSGTMNHEGVREVGRLFSEAFAKIGFQPRWVNLPDSVQRAGHLFAERRGSKGKRLLLIGHLDTVFEEDSPFQKLERNGNRAAGPGAADMKGGDVVILYALMALEQLGALENTTITVALTGDEEAPGFPLSVSRAALIEAGQRSDVALGFESGAKGLGVVARRSSTEWIIEIEGTRSHSSRIFSEAVGSGAIFEAARILNAFHEQVKGEKYLTFNAGVMLGGTTIDYDEAQTKGSAFGKTNVVPQSVIINGGLRTISAAQTGRAQAKMKAITENMNLPGTSAIIHFAEGYPAMSPTDENYKLLEQFSQVSQDLGYEAIEAFDPGKRGAADISFVPFITGLDGLGVYGSGAHTPNEVVDLASLPTAIKRAAILIYRLTRD